MKKNLCAMALTVVSAGCLMAQDAAAPAAPPTPPAATQPTPPATAPQSPPKDAAAPAPAAETTADLPSAETLLDKYTEATGGLKAYQSIKTQSATGKFSVPSAGITGDLKTFNAWPDKYYSAVDIPGVGKIEEGSNSQVAWENSALQGARIKTGDEAAMAIREGSLDVHANWRKYYKSVKTVGLENVDGKPAYKVLMTPTQGAPETVYFEKDSGLLVKQTTIADTPMGKVPVEMVFSGYKTQGPLKMPGTVEIHSAGQTFNLTVDNVTFNQDIPPSTFELPAAIKALQSK